MRYHIEEGELFPTYVIKGRELPPGDEGVELEPYIAEAHQEALEEFLRLDNIVLEAFEAAFVERQNRPKPKQGRLVRDISPEETAEKYKDEHRFHGPKNKNVIEIMRKFGILE